MSNKYIIRNCPSYDDYFNPNETCGEKYSQYCQDCTDCVLKQIVARLIRVCEANLCSNCDGCDWENGCGDKDCGTYQANEILQLLDIQEVENGLDRK